MNIFELSEHAENIARAARKLANAACQWSASEKAAAGDREEYERALSAFGMAQNAFSLAEGARKHLGDLRPGPITRIPDESFYPGRGAVFTPAR